MNQKEITKDQIRCTTCGMIKNTTLLDIESNLIPTETKKAKCCKNPFYLWVEGK